MVNHIPYRNARPASRTVSAGKELQRNKESQVRVGEVSSDCLVEGDTVIYHVWLSPTRLQFDSLRITALVILFTELRTILTSRSELGPPGSRTRSLISRIWPLMLTIGPLSRVAAQIWDTLLSQIRASLCMLRFAQAATTCSGLHSNKLQFA